MSIYNLNRGVRGLRFTIGIVAGFLFLSGAPPSVSAGTPGVIDLSSRAFTMDNSFRLTGTWEFYWKRYIDPGSSPSTEPVFVQVPQVWNKFELDGQPLPAQGFASYRATVLLPPDRPDRLAMKLRRVKMAHRMYINGVLVSQVGSPGTTADATQSGHRPDIAEFSLPPDARSIEIVLHIANFSYAKGGLSQSPRIGSVQSIYKRRMDLLFRQAVIAGSMFLIAFYHLGLWFKRQKETSALFFGLFCIGLFVRELVCGEKYLLVLFPGISAETMLTLELASNFLSASMLHLFVSSVFPEEFYKPLKRVSVAALIINALVLALTNLQVKSAFIPVMEIYTVAVFCHILLWVGIKSVYRKRQGAILFMAGFIVLFVLGMNDILYERGVVNTAYIFGYGVFVFVLIQALILSMRFSNAFTELEDLKESLEEKVALRTAELAEARDNAVRVSEENRLLNQNITTAIERERKAIANELHDGFNATLVGIKLHLQAIKRIAENPEVAAIASSLSEIVSQKYEATRDLVRRLRPEVLDTLGLGSALKNLVSTLNQAKSGCVFDCEIESELKDLNEEISIAIYRITQEATTNIVKYADASEALVSLSGNGGVRLSISDNGRGYDPETTKENVGLISMRERVIALGGTFSVRSAPGSGTTLEVRIPNQ